jgi:hypothetical protein
MWIAIRMVDGERSDEMVGPFGWHADAHAFCEMKRVLLAQAWLTRHVAEAPDEGFIEAWKTVRTAAGVKA